MGFDHETILRLKNKLLVSDLERSQGEAEVLREYGNLRDRQVCVLEGKVEALELQLKKQSGRPLIECSMDVILALRKANSDLENCKEANSKLRGDLQEFKERHQDIERDMDKTNELLEAATEALLVERRHSHELGFKLNQLKDQNSILQTGMKHSSTVTLKIHRADLDVDYIKALPRGGMFAWSADVTDNTKTNTVEVLNVE